ncbi:MAG: hypothetical protein ACRYGP_31255 [Janthinobacterium lividum]
MGWSNRTWASDRTRKIRFTRFAIFLVIIIAIYSYPYWGNNFFGTMNTQNMLRLVGSRFSGIDFLLDEDLPKNWAEDHEEIFTFLISIVVAGLVACRWPLDRFHEKILASFNYDVLLPIDRLHIDRDRSEDSFVQINWMPGETGPRRTAWEMLEKWCFGRASSWSMSSGRSPISAGILVGRSGSGKSRMAHRWARTLARRDRLGGQNTWRDLVWSVGTYCRRVLPILKARRDDPWDSALLDRREGDNGFDESCARLKGWRPRRPTLLVLDDPLPGWSRMARTALEEANVNIPFAHVVCLLIVNQTVPADTGFEYDSATRRWVHEGNVLTPQPIQLPEAAWFTPEETTQAAFRSGHVLNRSPALERSVRENLFEVTKGNPLLVVLAIEWIRDGRLIAEMTADELTRNRAKRIVASVKHRGFTADVQLAALALSTLAGGAPRDKIHSAAERMFGEPPYLPSTSDIQACFPTEPFGVGGAARVPAVRPDLVADAFVDCVLDLIGIDRARAMVEEAFRLNPGAMLRSMRRIHSRSSPMTEALASVDPARIPGLDPVDVALALADIAAILPSRRSTSRHGRDSRHVPHAGRRCNQSADAQQTQGLPARYVSLVRRPVGSTFGETDPGQSGCPTCLRGDGLRRVLCASRRAHPMLRSPERPRAGSVGVHQWADKSCPDAKVGRNCRGACSGGLGYGISMALGPYALLPVACGRLRWPRGFRVRLSASSDGGVGDPRGSQDRG